MKRMFVLGLLVGAATLSSPSEACMREMAIHDQGPTNPAAEVAKSDTQLESGTSSAALATIVKVFPTLKAAAPSASEPLRNHALRNAALAIVRTNGVAGGAGFKPSEAAQNVTWAQTTLRGLLALRATDASLEADLAEALAHSANGKDEALKRLNALAEKDLIGSPQALVELARLRKEKGDEKGTTAALDKCRSMTTVAQASLCTLSPSSPAKPVSAPPAQTIAAKGAPRS